jgi:hypothetical protein
VVRSEAEDERRSREQSVRAHQNHLDATFIGAVLLTELNSTNLPQAARVVGLSYNVKRYRLCR